MAAIFEEKLKALLEKGERKSTYILYGNDAYLKGTYLNKIVSQITSTDDVFNYAKFTGRCDLQEVYDAVLQLPLMSDGKCVVLSDYDYLHCDSSDLERLLVIIEEVPPETTFVLYFDGIETDAKKGAKFKRLIAAAEKAGGVAAELNHRSQGELVKMLCNGAAKRGLKMDPAVGKYLVETAGEDINILVNELEKLCAFAKEGTVTKAHIDEACTVNIEANIFKLADAIIACNSTLCLKMLDDLLYMRTEPMVIFYNVAGVFVDILRLYAAKTQGLGNSEVVKTFKYANKAFLVGNAERNLRRLDFVKLKACLEALTETDSLMKSFGAEPRRILEEMAVKLIYIISTGETLD